MYTRYYDGYGRQNPTSVGRQDAIEKEEQNEISLAPVENVDSGVADDKSSVAGLSARLPFGLDIEDLLLIAVLLLVLGDAEDNDYFLPIVLGFLLLTK